MLARSALFVRMWLTTSAYGAARVHARVYDVPVRVTSPHQYLPSGSLILQLLGTSRVEVLLEPQAAAPVPLNAPKGH
ncbi:MAG: hypothetical protein HPY54_02510 [Chthonomonadetes bacterium]|nr:hypothetical protein [Chthonomonadetes bacterium]